jgi:hypothetical protein
MSSENEAAQIKAVQQWLEQVVIGLNLCPFASKPYRDNQVRIQVCDSDNELSLLETLQAELTLIDESPASEIETTLLLIPNLLHDFEDYNQFLDLVDGLLDEFEWAGEYQVASFHPQYCFAGVAPESPENLTNRSPYPLLHIIRESSIEAALEHYDNPEAIPQRNIARMNALSEDEKRHLFAYLF